VSLFFVSNPLPKRKVLKVKIMTKLQKVKLLISNKMLVLMLRLKVLTLTVIKILQRIVLR
jgi:hypothetical protein